jgi:sulfite exporter TauE/SafE
MLGKHHYRYAYFLGRLLSYSLAGLAAGELGAITNITLNYYHLSSLTSFIFGGIIFIIGIFTITNFSLFRIRLFSGVFKLNNTISLLLLRDKIWPTFLFGFLTLALPCGQTMIVFTACALSADPYVGFFNGFLLALLTSPSLFLAMRAQLMCAWVKNHSQTIIGASALGVAILAFCRGLADLGYISHWVLNPYSPSYLHIVMY